MLSLPALLRLPLWCRAGVAHDGPGEPRHPEDCAMEATLLYPRDLIAERVVFTPADHAQIALCRGEHNRLGLAYQMAFLRLTGRFPSQQPLELLPDVLAFVAGELALAPTVIEAYAQRQATVSAHQEQIPPPSGVPGLWPGGTRGTQSLLARGGPASRPPRRLGRASRDLSPRPPGAPARRSRPSAGPRENSATGPASWSRPG